jgi:hypothetical protein
MMDNGKRLIDRVDALREMLQKLESGNMHVNDLEPLTEEARLLYEQLVVIKYRAMERHVQQEQPVIVPEPVAPAVETFFPPVAEVPAIPATPEPDPTPEVQEPAAPGLFSGFKLNIGKPSSKNELKPTSPAAKEPRQEFKPGKQESIPIPDQPLPFNNPEFSTPMPVRAEVTEQPVEEKQAPVPNQMNLIDAIVQDKKPDTAASVNDKFVRNEDQSLAARLGKAPIKDLRTAIGINQKFLFMNDLFEGENTHYNEAVEKLNSFGTREEALRYLDKELSVRFGWTVDDENVGSFRELVERRYL